MLVIFDYTTIPNSKVTRLKILVFGNKIKSSWYNIEKKVSGF